MLATAAWLQEFLDPLLDDPSVMTTTLIVITFDASAAPNENHIYTVF